MKLVDDGTCNYKKKASPQCLWISSRHAKLAESTKSTRTVEQKLRYELALGEFLGEVTRFRDRRVANVWLILGQDQIFSGVSLLSRKEPSSR